MSFTVFALFAALVLVSAIWVVTLRNLFRAALSLGLALLGVAAIFLLLEAEFLAFVQILVYVGAILTLVIFAIMLTAKLQTAVDVPSRRQPVAAALACTALFAVLVAATWGLSWSPYPAGDAVNLSALGRELVETLVLPFEVISLVFVAAVVGAIAIAARR
ncbi:MAG: hypothetical protein COV75_04880 [Candidatus Omnitrophica bacterium CG11_big_fil_rev_8_21_14_0_20_63_9]|nr:MAG: hypothetical protein COV75_04880 [Candidatus Omnitrophica bacterium CG11_big_fil_rev_8_21_14_0_20_63_9]